jgi:hypothetical protein
MRLSEAIRLGAMISPQARGHFFQQTVSGKESVIATCALGAASLAAGGSSFPIARPAFHTWPILALTVPAAELPSGIAKGRRPLRLADLIILLNDMQGWTRTEIADWVQQFEERHLPEAVSDEKTAQTGERNESGTDGSEEEGVTVLV